MVISLASKILSKSIIKSSAKSSGKISEALSKQLQESIVKQADKKTILTTLKTLEQDTFIKSSINPTSKMADTYFNLQAKQIAQILHTTPSTIPEVIALEKKMTQLGVQVCFADNLSTGKIITSAVEKLKVKGYKLPKQIFLITPKEAELGGYCPLKFASPEKSYIFINKDIEHFGEQAGAVGEISGISTLKSALNRKSEMILTPQLLHILGLKMHVANTPECAIFHEIGHFIHQDKKLGLKEAQKIWKATSCNTKLLSNLTREVSAYATMGNKYEAGEEFVAEVFAGLMSGKQYSYQVMSIYNALKGPKVI